MRNQRDDYLHKKSNQIIRAFGTICLEDLNIQGMMQNRKLALAIGEVGWGSSNPCWNIKPIGMAKISGTLADLSQHQKCVLIVDIFLKNYN